VLIDSILAMEHQRWSFEHSYSRAGFPQASFLYHADGEQRCRVFAAFSGLQHTRRVIPRCRELLVWLTERLPSRVGGLDALFAIIYSPREYVPMRP
jgi:hypothetical protein